MNTQAEKAFKLWLETEGLLVPVHTGLTGEAIPVDDQVISCYASNSENVVGPLNKVTMQVIVATPPHMDASDDETVALDAHRTVLATVRNLLESFDSSQLKTVYDQDTGDVFSGGYLEGEDESVTDGRWVTTINFIFGVNRS